MRSGTHQYNSGCDGARIDHKNRGDKKVNPSGQTATASAVKPAGMGLLAVSNQVVPQRRAIASKGVTMSARERWEYSDPATVLERKQEVAERAGEIRVIDPFGKLVTIKNTGPRPRREVDFRLRVSLTLHERLERWGEIMRERRRPDISMTGKVCHRLAVLAGVVRDEWKQPPTGAEVSDATLVEAAWRGEPLPMKDKVMLAGYYCYGVHPSALCRAAAIPYRQFDPLMFHAVTSIGNILDVRARARDNRSTI